jgi:homoserine O-acetyltransferase
VPDSTSKAEPGQHTVGEFRFGDGRRLNVTLACHTLRSLDTRAGRAVMVLHGTTGSGQQFLQPSIADSLFGPDFPRYGDIVEGQHRLLVQGAGHRATAAAARYLDGRDANVDGGERYPGMTQALMAIVGLPERITGRNLPCL